MLDCAASFQAFCYILLPMSYLILTVVFILVLLANFSEYPTAAVLLQSQDKLPLAVVLEFFLAEGRFLWRDFAAVAVLSGLPITNMFLFCQRFLTSGLTAGAVKD